MTGLTKQDIKNAGFLFGPYEVVATTGSAATLALAATGQDNVWNHLGIPLSFDETDSADVIERRTLENEENQELAVINTNMISVSFTFNIPKIKVTSSTDDGFDLTRWVHGKATKTSFKFGESGTAFTTTDDGFDFSLRVYDGTNHMVYRNGKLTSVSVTFDDGLYTVSCDAMFLSENKSIATSFTEQMEPYIADSGTSTAALTAIGPIYSTPLTNLDAKLVSVKNGTSSIVGAEVRNLSISKTFNVELVKALGEVGCLDIVKTTNSNVTGSFELLDIDTFSESSGIVAALKTAYGSESAQLQFEFYKGGTSTLQKKGFLIIPKLILSERKDSYSESDFATRSYSFSGIVANIDDSTLS